MEKIIEEKLKKYKYRKQKSKYETGYGNFMISTGKYFYILTALSLLALLFSFWNAAGLRKELDYSIQEYCDGITGQITEAIRDGIYYKKIELENVADSVSKVYDKYNSKELEEFLDRKANILEFDELALIDKENKCVAFSFESEKENATQDIVQLARSQDLFQHTVQVGFFEGQRMFYAAPVYTNRQLSHVLIGVRSKEKMQSLISAKAFLGRTASCIIDSNATVLLSPVDMESFFYLDKVFGVGKDTGRLSDAEKIQNDMSRGSDGMLEFFDKNRERNMLAYNSLGIQDWVLLTIVPVDLISGSASTYILRSSLLIGGISLVFLFSLMMVYHINTQNRKKLMEIAFTDSVTGGLNGIAFQEMYHNYIERQKAFPCAVVFLNIRNFKLFNEEFGFSTGNQMLRHLYQTIESQLDKEAGEFVARSEVDHFFICMQGDDLEVIQKRLDRMVRKINRLRRIDFPRYQIKFTEGCCLVKDDQMDIHQIQDRARMAAGNETENLPNICVFFDETVAEQLKKEQELDEMFEKSLANHEFKVYMQPKVNLKTHQPEGAEALVRWNHPQKGLIMPNIFIPMFERNGKICKLDLYVFEEVCKFYKRREAAGKPWYPVSVNLSRYHFFDENFLDDFYRIFQDYGLPKYSIEFELTESMFFDKEHIECIKKGIRKMHEMGFKCSMDDFGFGYSSLGLLKEFDVDTLKMDRSFFMDISSNKARDIIQSVVELAIKLEVGTVAEGIEQTEQMDFLYSINCDTVQGYFFSKPLPIEEFEEWISQYERERM